MVCIHIILHYFVLTVIDNSLYTAELIKMKLLVNSWLFTVSTLMSAFYWKIYISLAVHFDMEKGLI